MSQTKTDETKGFFRILTEDLLFEDASKISSAKIQRLFDNPSVAPFLTEFIHNVTKDNVLSSVQITRYNHLCDQGKTKAGVELQRLIARLHAQNTDCEIRKSELDQRIEKAQLKKRKLEFELKKIQEFKEQSRQDLDKRNEIALELTNHLKGKKNEAQSMNDQVTKTISLFPKVYQELCSIVENSDSKGYLISQVELTELLRAEESYNTQLTSFVEKQFLEISSKIVVDLSEPETAHKMCSVVDSNLLSGETEETRKQIAADIKRAELSYSDQEKKSISAEALESSAGAALSFLQEERSKILKSPLKLYESDIRQSLASTAKKAKACSKQLDEHTKSKIPHLISQGTPLHTTHLLTGDYHRKLIRQEYFIEKQQKVISLLRLQHTRLNLLWILLQAEEASHTDTGKQIPVLLAQLHLMLEESVAETKWFQENQEKDLRSTHSTSFHPSDKVAIATARILEVKSMDSSDSVDFVSHDGLSQAAENLQKQLDVLWKTAACSPNLDEIHINNLSMGVHECESLLKSSDDVNDECDFNHFVLTPESLQRMRDQLQSEFDRLSSLVLTSTKQIEKKKHLLEYDKKAAASRTAWVDFQLQRRAKAEF